ncbi:hypothetical protein B296_00049160 [Ensete ventricosum]|uniref:Uncharacterized protein n=1 Tax=Ensete ventricosum TaxID=4639 RepID=A0A426XDH5_ENSVE|nr:hypothetical protein B296_00049160 [Ensete ventricosum]
MDQRSLHSYDQGKHETSSYSHRGFSEPYALGVDPHRNDASHRPTSAPIGSSTYAPFMAVSSGSTTTYICTHRGSHD